ncbi:MAG TPA: glycosyltransferase [Candidatus Saccharimonadales bacterium]
MTDNKRVLIIDCQVLQTNAWDRGMGKYSLSLIDALHRQKLLPAQTILMLGKNLPADPGMLEALQKACPGASITYLDLHPPSSRRKDVETQAYNKKTIDAYIAGLTGQSVDFLILSLFLDQALIVFPDNARKLLLFYDLIPFLFEKRYAERINYNDYLNRFRTIFEADLIYTISQTVADDMAVYLGIPKARLHNINGASIKRSHLAAQKPGIDLPGEYILMNSGDDLRKNNLNAVKGFAEFNEHNDNKFSLVITSSFTDSTRKEMEVYSDRLVFTGNISDPELKWIYENAQFVFCPSEYEGLGLPVLEAMETGKKIACSDIPVFREISDDAFYYFDPSDFLSIADGLAKAEQGHEWATKRSKYAGVVARYNWDLSACDYDKGYTKRFETEITDTTAKPRLAIFTPHPSGYSAIGKVIAELHATLSGRFEIDYYFDYQPATHGHVRPDFLSHAARYYEAADFTISRYREYDAVIYNIGNSDYHLNTIKNALYLPGYVILHDTHLKGAFGELLRLGRISEERLQLEEMLDAKNTNSPTSYLTSLLNNQLGVIVHSRFARKAIHNVISNNVETLIANLPLAVPELNRIKSDKDKLQVGLAGILADVKGLTIIEDLAGDPDFRDYRFKVFGFSFIKPETLNRLERFDNVKIYRDLSDFDFQTQLAKLDVLINYRMEYNGETSLTVLEAMRYGVVPFVRDTGWYSELPDDAATQVSDISELKLKLSKLQTENSKLRQTGSAAKSYIDREHSHGQYLQKLLELIGQPTGGTTNPNFAKAELLRKTKNLKQFRERSKPA